MKKIILVAVILILGFSSVSNATLLYEDTSLCYFRPLPLVGAVWYTRENLDLDK